MTQIEQYQWVILGLIAAHMLTLWLLWASERESNAWRDAWTRDSAELLQWKRHAVMRHPRTGKYMKKDRKHV